MTASTQTDLHSAASGLSIAMIAAMDRHQAIGADNRMPWHLPDDLKHFKTLTQGKPVVMGRKTFESIGRRPLPHRLNIVVSRQKQPEKPLDAATFDPTQTHLCYADSIAGALSQIAPMYPQSPEVMIMGGGQIYQQCLPIAQTLYLTQVDAEIEGDAFFPTLDPQAWQCTAQRAHPADVRHAFAFEFLTYQRLNADSITSDPSHKY